MQRVHLIAAARPNFMKVGPLWHALKTSGDFEPVLIHTGQHYDANMSDDIFADLNLPKPDYHMGIGSGTHAEQTGGVMIAYEKITITDRPHWLVVVGDVNSTLACALVGAKQHIRTVHLEAGLRSGDRAMPEEINRLATDAVSDVLWTPSPDADENLIREGADPARITRVGNIMLDSYEMVRPKIEAEDVATRFGLNADSYGVVTLHRPSNVDDVQQLAALVASLIEIAEHRPLIFPVHPRTRERLQRFGLAERLEVANIRLIEPLSYLPFMSLVSNAGLVITDSGGLQEETTYLGIPCLTLRDNTERPITLTHGTNRLVNSGTLLSTYLSLGNMSGAGPRRPDLWDGQTARRCVADLRTRAASIPI